MIMYMIYLNRNYNQCCLIECHIKILYDIQCVLANIVYEEQNTQHMPNFVICTSSFMFEIYIWNYFVGIFTHYCPNRIYDQCCLVIYNVTSTFCFMSVSNCRYSIWKIIMTQQCQIRQYIIHHICWIYLYWNVYYNYLEHMF